MLRSLLEDRFKLNARIEVRELVAGSFLEGAPMVPVSAKTGDGLDDFRAALLAVSASVRGRAVDAVTRLPIAGGEALHGRPGRGGLRFRSGGRVLPRSARRRRLLGPRLVHRCDAAAFSGRSEPEPNQRMDTTIARSSIEERQDPSR